MTEEYYEKQFGKYLEEMENDLGNEIEPPTDEDMEEMANDSSR